MTNDYQTFNGRTVAQTLLCVVSQKNPCPIARSISGVGGEGGHYLSLYDQVSSKTPLTPSRHIRGQFLIVNDDDNIINFYMKYIILWEAEYSATDDSVRTVRMKLSVPYMLAVLITGVVGM